MFDSLSSFCVHSVNVAKFPGNDIQKAPKRFIGRVLFMSYCLSSGHSVDLINQGRI